jgi:hypothetical protein
MDSTSLSSTILYKYLLLLIITLYLLCSVLHICTDGISGVIHGYAGVYIPGYYKGIYNNMYVQDIT